MGSPVPSDCASNDVRLDRPNPVLRGKADLSIYGIDWARQAFMVMEITMGGQVRKGLTGLPDHIASFVTQAVPFFLRLCCELKAESQQLTNWCSAAGCQLSGAGSGVINVGNMALSCW